MSFFCNLPFTEIQTDGNTARPCCVFSSKQQIELSSYYANQELFDAKKKLLNGTPPTQCLWCVEQEKSTGNSFRLLAETFHSELSDKIKQYNNPTYFDIRNVTFTTSNICNLKCLPCENASFVRDSELVKLNLKKNIPILEKNNYQSLLNYNFNKITLLGGEPFYDLITFELLNELIVREKSHNIQVDINTNMTAITEEKMDFLVKNFDKITIKASIDGIGTVNDYLRYPSRWETIEKNIELVKSYTDVDLIITGAVSNLALIKFHQVIDWVVEKDLSLFMTHVSNPTVLAPSLLPIDIKKQLLEIYQSQKNRLSGKIHDRTEYCIDSCIHICSDIDTNLSKWPAFISWINKHDQLRQQSLTQIFPEIIDYV
jgi:sulfatase maturation enzyme AslB (radical SAM superfamily)